MSEWKDVWEMLEDIAEHVSQTGDSILPADVPPKVIYQSCADVEKTWKISSANVKASFKRLVDESPFKAALVKGIFHNGESRISFIKALQGIGIQL